MTRSDIHTHPSSDEFHVYFMPAQSKTGMTVIKRDWQAMKALIGGYVEEVRSQSMPELPCGCNIVMMVDEDGRMKRRIFNFSASLVAGMDILGDAFLIAEGLVGTKKQHDVDYFSLPQAFNEWQPGQPVPGSTSQPWEDD